jgi:hypothetical protein
LRRIRRSSADPFDEKWFLIIPNGPASMPQQSTDTGVGSTCPVRGGGTDISAWARPRRETVLAGG